MSLADNGDTADSEDWRQRAQSKFIASRQARDAVRKRNQTTSDSGNVREESVVSFNTKFIEERTRIYRALEELLGHGRSVPMTEAASVGNQTKDPIGEDASKVDGEDTVEHLAGLADRVKALQQRVAEATLFLPAYDARQAQADVTKLGAGVDYARAELVPRKKFSFRSKGTKSRSGASKSKAPEHTNSRSRESDLTKPLGNKVMATKADQPEEFPGLAEAYRVSGLHGAEVNVEAEEANREQDYGVTDLEDCRVSIPHVLGALRLRRLSGCDISCGPVCGPIYIESCHDCIIMAAGRQLRIHDSQGLDIYVHVASGPVIEDCSGLRFAPAPDRYCGYTEQLEEAGLSGVANAWRDVKDFKWHRVQTSPNWSIITEEDRRTDFS